MAGVESVICTELKSVIPAVIKTIVLFDSDSGMLEVVGEAVWVNCCKVFKVNRVTILNF